MDKVLFSSQNTEWETPDDLFKSIDKLFHFTLDVCATKDNTKCDNFFTIDDDALTKDWKEVCWMNPPYGRGIYTWVEKAYTESKKHGSTIVCLLPARVDTKWWHDFCCNAEYLFLKGRLKFSQSYNAAPFPSVLVVFRPRLKDLSYGC